MWAMRHSTGSRCARLAPLALTLPVILTLPGCARPLLSPSEERSPFDRYDALRAQFAPQDIEDEFGRPQRNLRARLSPRD